MTVEPQKRTKEYYERYSDKTVEELAEMQGISIRTVYRDLNKIRNGSMKVIDKKEPKELDWNTLSELYEAVVKLEQETDAKQNEVTIYPPNMDKYLLVAVFGDLHFGSKHQDLKTLIKHQKMVINEPNAIAVQVGDLVNAELALSNRVKTTRYPPSDILRLRDARRAAYKFFAELGDKMAGFVIGNHDERLIYGADLDIGEEVAKKIEGAYLGHNGNIIVRFHDELSYKIYLTHGFGSRSMYNPNHGAAKHFLVRGRTMVDVVLHGHIHEGIAISDYLIDDYTRGVAMRTGAYIHPTTDFFGEKIGGLAAEAETGAIILSPHEKKMMPFSSLETAMKILNLLNGK